MEFQEIRTNFFIISFATKCDEEKVLGGCPWLFDNHLFVLKEYDAQYKHTCWNSIMIVFGFI